MANILITGGTGFIGSAIVRYFTSKGHHLYILTRSERSHANTEQIHYVTWPVEMSASANHFPKIDVIINLAGDPINKGRWTELKKQSILKSRVRVTEQLLTLIRHFPEKPKLLINASAIGYYGFSETREFTENDIVAPNHFLMEVSEQWEREARKAEADGVRVVLARIGIVLGKNGGALAPMVLPYKLFAGGKVASGKQWLSWIHMDDVVGLMEHIMLNESIKGAVNFTAPQPQRMDDFGRQIGAVLRRPHLLPVPAFALRLLFGEMADLLIRGQHVLPKVAIESGYRFRYEQLRPALENILL